MRGGGLVAVVTSALCCAPTAWHVYRDEGATLSFPAPPDVRRVREGPWADATVVSARHGGVTYELARFVLTAVPDGVQRAALLAEVERGLAARRGVVDAEGRDEAFQNRPARRLVVGFDDGTEARFFVFFRDERTLVELSVFGPADRLEEAGARFFGGYSPRDPSGASPTGPAPSSSPSDRGPAEPTTQ